MKEKFLDALVNSYYEGHKIDSCGLDELLYDVTEPFSDIICELLNISDEEYWKMLDEALTIADSWKYNDMMAELRRAGVIKKD